MTTTDSFKALARRFEISVQEVRDHARALGLKFSYSADRRTWFLNERAAEVIKFNRYLAGELA